jgi:hypothetical protein
MKLRAERPENGTASGLPLTQDGGGDNKETTRASVPRSQLRGREAADYNGKYERPD